MTERGLVLASAPCPYNRFTIASLSFHSDSISLFHHVLSYSYAAISNFLKNGSSLSTADFGDDSILSATSSSIIFVFPKSISSVKIIQFGTSSPDFS